MPRLSEQRLIALGYRRSFGMPKGQLADLRKPLDDGRGLHVRIYDEHMTVHWDRKALSAHPVGHLVGDAPEIALAGGATLLIALTLLLL